MSERILIKNFIRSDRKKQGREKFLGIIAFIGKSPRSKNDIPDKGSFLLHSTRACQANCFHCKHIEEQKVFSRRSECFIFKKKISKSKRFQIHFVK
jgi:hypothetical protein